MSRTELRNTSSRLIFRLGNALYKIGLWLCGLSGHIDAGTDRIPGFPQQPSDEEMQRR